MNPPYIQTLPTLLFIVLLLQVLLNPSESQDQTNKNNPQSLLTISFNVPTLPQYLFAPATSEQVLLFSGPPPLYSEICFECRTLPLLTKCYSNPAQFSVRHFSIDGIPEGEHTLTAIVVDSETSLPISSLASMTLHVNAARPLQDPYESRAIVVTSVTYRADFPESSRPWFNTSVLPRIQQYAERTNATVVLKTSPEHPCEVEIENGGMVLDTRTCAMREKLVNLAHTLKEFDR